MKNLLVFAIGVSLLFGAGSVAAQEPAAFPAIVVFQDDANFDPFAARYRADERARANPAAWGYLDRGVAGRVQALEAGLGFRADHVYSAAIRGFAARLAAEQILQLEGDPDVAYVEADGTMTTMAQTLPWGIARIDADFSSTLAGNGSGAVSDVRAYVIDTGIYGHTDLNVVNHVSFVGGPNRDCHGHGTHVAGTIGAKDNTSDVVGAAPGVPLVGVKVLGCGGSGTTSGVIQGVDWVTANAVKPAIANMSLGGGASQALDDAVRNSAASGVFYSIAAGNSGADACSFSPARAGAGTDNGIMTIAATDSANREASFSNYGECVDAWAPGVGILSTRKGGGTTTMSGTSMAAPHAGGTAVLYLSAHTGASAANVEAALSAALYATGFTSKDKVSPIGLINAGTF